MEVKMYYKKGKYTNNNGEERNFINFYAACGEKLIPVEVKYFGKDNKPDNAYATRKGILEAFADKVLPIVEQKRLLHQKNLNLAAQRDMLLPRLMSGKLEVN